MATVEFRIKNLKAADNTRATLAEVTGSIDATSIVQFQNVMDKLVEKGVRNLILDCANVKYINSTGLGTLLKYVDTFESRDGHIVFTKVPSKVMLVMEMLGFNALFAIVPDEAAALRHFAGKPAAPATVAEPMPQVAMPGVVQPGIAQPGIAQPGIAQPGIAQPGIAQPGIAQPTVAPAPSVVQPAAAPPAGVVHVGGYPAAAECTRCHLTLDVPAAGKYKCPRCQTVLDARASGDIQFLAPKKAIPVSISLPATSDLIDGIRGLVKGLARQMGFGGAAAGQIGEAVVTASKSMAELAYADNAASSLHLVVIPDANSITVRISDYGDPIPASPDGAPEDPRFGPVTSVMDSVLLKPNPKGSGNLLTLTKRSGA